jgi:prephenate dehydrogenase
MSTAWQPVTIIGAGRMGRGLELALRGAGAEVTLLSR